MQETVLFIVKGDSRSEAGMTMRAGHVRPDSINRQKFGRCGRAASTGRLRPILPDARSTGKYGTRVPDAASSRGRDRLQSRGR